MALDYWRIDGYLLIDRQIFVCQNALSGFMDGVGKRKVQMHF